MSDKLFTIAGTSVFEGQTVFRVATGKLRIRETALIRHGDTRIKLIELPKPMTKDDAFAYIEKLRAKEKAARAAAREAKAAGKEPVKKVAVAKAAKAKAPKASSKTAKVAAEATEAA